MLSPALTPKRKLDVPSVGVDTEPSEAILNLSRLLAVPKVALAVAAPV